ncbi:hypothetical protein [Pandoraea fibrosis]|nr:hypothetical protein [Pandoraea fibrosis]
MDIVNVVRLASARALIASDRADDEAKRKKPDFLWKSGFRIWLRGQDLNL